jgi:hypothetical protein
MATMQSRKVRTLEDAVAFIVEARHFACRAAGGVPVALWIGLVPSDGTGGTLYAYGEMDGDEVPANAAEIGFRRSPAGTRRVPMSTTDEQLRSDGWEAFRREPILAY